MPVNLAVPAIGAAYPLPNEPVELHAIGAQPVAFRFSLHRETEFRRDVAHVIEAESQRLAAPSAVVLGEPLWVRGVLIVASFLVVGGLILVPMVYVFVQALRLGIGVYLQNLLSDADTRHAIWLTFTVAPLSVGCNTLFGIAAAWTIARFRFPGRTLLTTLLDVPFAISPVVAGLMFVLLFGMQGFFGPALRSWGVQVIFAWPGLVLATTFVTLPFVVRELIPLMQAIGDEEELAAVSLGASPWQLFWRITLPNIKWGLVYGIIQCQARAIGEFGAVYVVSGHIAGETDTMPLRVEKLFQEYNNPGSFAVASLLTIMALAMLVTKLVLERTLAVQKAARSMDDGRESHAATAVG